MVLMKLYCISVNDTFVMNAWAKDLQINNVKLLPDGNGEFTDGMGMLVEKKNLGFGQKILALCHVGKKWCH